MKVRGCRLCKLGDCMCHRVTRWNNIRNIQTPDDFDPGYRKKYLLRTYGIDCDDWDVPEKYHAIIHGYINGVPPYVGDRAYINMRNALNALR